MIPQHRGRDGRPIPDDGDYTKETRIGWLGMAGIAAAAIALSLVIGFCTFGFLIGFAP